MARSSGTAGQKRANDYKNCVYACRYCNGTRLNKPTVDHRKRRLLDPVRSDWGDHFTIGVDRIDPKPGDDDAAYTEEAYGINDVIRLEIRRKTRERIQKALKIVAKGAARIAAARLAASTASNDAAGRADDADLLSDYLEVGRGYLHRHRTPPLDAPNRCRCLGRPSVLSARRSLPPWVSTHSSQLP